MEPAISIVEVFTATLVFSSLMIIFLVYRQVTFGKLGAFVLLFLWFTFTIAIAEWWGNLLPIPPDSYGYYFERAKAIAASGFDPSVMTEYLKPGIGNIGHRVFISLEALVIYVSTASYPFLHVGMIFLSTLAVYYAYRCSQLLAGFDLTKYTIIGFAVYFAWYWSVLQNLREAPILLLLGIFLISYFAWWKTSRPRHGMATLLTAVLIVLLRIEMAFLMAAVAGLTVLLRDPTFVRRFAKVIIAIPVLLVISLNIVIDLTNDDVLSWINAAREVRWRSGEGYQATNMRVQSYQELAVQAPDTLRFFLVPIWPWQVQVGSVYFKAYVHSLTAFALVLLSLRGMWCYFRGYIGDPIYRKPLQILIIAFTVTAGIFSLGEIGASAAARHATFFYYFLLSSFAPIGLSLFFHKHRTPNPRPSEKR